MKAQDAVHPALAQRGDEMSGRSSRSGAPAERTRPRRRTSSIGRRLWWFVLPAAAAYLFVVVVPSIQGVSLSFTDWSAFSPDREFIGFDNYVSIFEGDALRTVGTTVVIAFAAMVGQNVLGLLLALALNGRVPGRNVLRTLIFAPVVVAPLVCGYLFKYIFGPPNQGALNDFFAAVGWDGLVRVWLGEPTSALWVVILVVTWQFVGISMVIFLAGLQGVPEEVMEAAAIDGAGSVRRFWFIVRPFLAPALTINLMLSLIGGLKIFDQIYATTAGGPAGGTETISTLIIKQFNALGAYGLSSALAVLLAIIVTVLSVIQFRFLRRQEGAA